MNKRIKDVADIEKSPCKVCVVRSMCSIICKNFLDYILLYVNLSKFPENQKYEIATNIFNHNKWLR